MKPGDGRNDFVKEERREGAKRSGGSYALLCTSYRLSTVKGGGIVPILIKNLGNVGRGTGPRLMCKCVRVRLVVKGNR
jgi:hypothetical protein